MKRNLSLTVALITAVTALACGGSMHVKSSLPTPSYSASQGSGYTLKFSLIKAEGAELGEANRSVGSHERAAYTATNLQQIAMRKYPSLFSRDKSAIPLSIDMSFGSKKHESSGISAFFSFVTLFTSPVLSESEHEVVVSTRIQSDESDDSIEVGDSAYFISQKEAMSIYSPIGSWIYDMSYSEARAFQAEQIVDSVVATILEANQGRLGEIYRERKARRTL